MRDGDLSLGGSCEKKAPHSRKPSLKYVYGSFGVSEDNVPGRKKNPQNKNSFPTATASREVAQVLEFATSDWGLDREAWAAGLG